MVVAVLLDGLVFGLQVEQFYTQLPLLFGGFEEARFGAFLLVGEEGAGGGEFAIELWTGGLVMGW